MTSVVIFGANGRTGRLVLAEALRRGLSVTAAVRNPESLRAVLDALPVGGRPRVVQADVFDPASLGRASAGHDAAISVIGGDGRKPGGVHDSDPGLPFWYRRILVPLFFRELYADMRVMETEVRATALAWVLVRPAYLVDENPRGEFRVEDGRNPRGGWKLGRADLARFLVDQLDTDT